MNDYIKLTNEIKALQYQLQRCADAIEVLSDATERAYPLPTQELPLTVKKYQASNTPERQRDSAALREALKNLNNS